MLRPAKGGIAGAALAAGLEHIDVVFAGLRAFMPMARFGSATLVTRYDDVREAFLSDDAFAVPYKAKLDVIMGGEPFFLGMRDGAAYRLGTSSMRKAMRREDVRPRLTAAFLAGAEAALAQGGGRIEVVDALARQVTFDVLSDYFGVGDPPGQDLRVITTRLFEFQFADPAGDKALRQEVDVMAPLLRAHVDAVLAQRQLSGEIRDDVLGRCLGLAAQGEPGFSDVEIRSALIGFLVGGVPQLPMVIPQALEQLLRRPEALAGAQAAARAGDDALLAGYIFEALRFDPLAPALSREVVKACALARGTARETALAEGSQLLVSFRSAMMDRRRVAAPRQFDPGRGANTYMHFGLGLHQCFGMQINLAVIPMVLKPLLKARVLRRAKGPEGRLRKRGAFAERLWVAYEE